MSKTKLLLVAVLFAVGSLPVLAQDGFDAAVEQGVTPMNQLGQEDLAGGTGESWPALSQSQFLRDTTLNAQLRSFYFNRDKSNGVRNEAWALGGSVLFKSGYVADRFAIGAVAYTSQPLYAPHGDGGTGILQADQDGYSVLGQLYLEAKLADHLVVDIGRKGYNTPYLNMHDVRMTPNTFEGVSVLGSSDPGSATQWRYGAGFISKIKDWTSQNFEWMSRAAGASVDRGVAVAGANVKRQDFSLGAVEYYSNDIINIGYGEATWRLPIAPGHALQLAGQYSDQRSTGSDLLKGYAFSTHQTGVRAELEAGAALLALAYTNTANGADMQSPWSGYPGYTSAQVQNFNQAGESAIMLRAGYDFSRHGLAGLSAYVLGVHGSGAASGSEDEGDLNLQWTPPSGPMRGTAFRLRYAHVDRHGGNPDTNDLRLIFNYDFPRP